MKKVFLVAFLFFVTIQSIAQINYENRLEFDLRDGYGSERIIEFGEEGFILFSKKTELVERQRERKFDMYSTDLELENTKTLLVDRDYSLYESAVLDNRFFSFYKTRQGDYILHSIEAGSLEQTNVSGKLSKKAIVKTMVVMGSYVYLHLIEKKSDYIFVINWRNGRSIETPIEIKGFKNKNLKKIRLQVIEDTEEVLLFMRANRNKKESDVYVLQFDEEGKKKGQFKLTESIEKNFSSISASPIDDDHYVFTGTYSTKGATTSQGLYFCEAEEGKVNYVEYYNFADLENFFKYLPKRKQEKIEKKKKRKKERGKELSYSYYIADHKIIELDDGYLFLGEAYYPTYRTETYTTYVNGQPVTRTRRVFDGYQYTHAILSKFDKYGEMVWDQIFEMWPSYKPFSVKRFISIADGDQDALNLVFASRGRITSKSFDFDGEILADNTSEEIQTNYEGDKTKSSFTNINYWYDDYFIAYGSQTIKNKEDKKIKRKRKVYFITKIQYE